MQQLTVSSLLRYLKNRLDTDNNLQKIYVSGEISNYHRHFSGHLYFTLKDESAAISCVMFKSSAATLSFEPKNGDKVVVYANTSIFETSGQLQLYVRSMKPEGLGDLYARYEALKKKLTAEGKFDDDHKIELEKTYIEKVAVLVGDKSAAMSDIRTTFARRWPLCKVDFYPVLVQGNDAPADIIAKLLEVDKKNYDAIILARGGGSFEDLFCFNDENLVNTIYDLKTFIVSGVGHEQDFTLCDFVCDLRAATPTASVELITPDIRDVMELIDEYENDLKDNLINIYEKKRMNFDYTIERLLHFQKHLENMKDNIDADIDKIRKSIIYTLNYSNEKIEHITSQMSMRLDFRLNSEKLAFKRLNTLLEAYNAENVLKRGYTMVLQDEKVVKKKAELLNKEFQIKFMDGTVNAIGRN